MCVVWMIVIIAAVLRVCADCDLGRGARVRRIYSTLPTSTRSTYARTWTIIGKRRRAHEKYSHCKRKARRHPECLRWRHKLQAPPNLLRPRAPWKRRGSSATAATSGGGYPVPHCPRMKMQSGFASRAMSQRTSGMVRRGAASRDGSSACRATASSRPAGMPSSSET